MLKDLLSSVQLDPRFCADLIRVSPEQFAAWLSGSIPIPRFASTELSAILGVSEAELLQSSARKSPEPPVIWYKLREARLTEADRELVGAIRKVGMYAVHLNGLQGRRECQFREISEHIRNTVDRSIAPSLQGQQAAAEFRKLDSALAHGKTGIGELLRPRLRHLGILVFETPVKRSEVEGCSFSAGDPDAVTPCLFANSFQSTWFRRNAVIAHELSHAIFDLESDQISIDYKGSELRSDVPEVRADAFARELLVPKEVLRHYTAQLAISWDNLRERELAELVAVTHTEKRTLLKAARCSDLIDDSQAERYGSFEVGQYLREMSEHALNTHEYIQRHGISSPKWTAEFRRARLGSRTLTLPIGFVKEVIDCLNSGLLTTAKAAEMLMIDRYTFLERFSDLLATRAA